MLREEYAVLDVDFGSLLKRRAVWRCQAACLLCCGQTQMSGSVQGTWSCLALPLHFHLKAQQGTHPSQDRQHCLAAGRDWLQVREDQNVSLEGQPSV